MRSHHFDGHVPSQLALIALEHNAHSAAPDHFQNLDVSNGNLRRGARIDVTFGGQTLKLMSIHLKSGCFSNDSSGSACNDLFRQVPILEGWIDAATDDSKPVIILGDFNRQFNIKGDIVWANLDDSEPAHADLTSVTENMPISCRDNRYTTFIDHIVFDKRSIGIVDRSSFQHFTYRQADRADWGKISDHCPVIVELEAP